MRGSCAVNFSKMATCFGLSDLCESQKMCVPLFKTPASGSLRNNVSSARPVCILDYALGERLYPMLLLRASLCQSGASSPPLSVQHNHECVMCHQIFGTQNAKHFNSSYVSQNPCSPWEPIALHIWEGVFTKAKCNFWNLAMTLLINSVT